MGHRVLCWLLAQRFRRLKRSGEFRDGWNIGIALMRVRVRMANEPLTAIEHHLVELAETVRESRRRREITREVADGVLSLLSGLALHIEEEAERVQEARAQMGGASHRGNAAAQVAW